MKRRFRIFLAGLLVAAVSSSWIAPTAVAEEERRSRDDIFINTDKEFTPANGVRGGRGTPGDPFVISGWDVRSITLKDTGKAVVIKNNTVEDQLTLNWNGGHVTVVDNKIGDLRVNENVTRKGDPTSGLIAHNTFGIVGQIRHFDGVFKRNVVTGDRRGIEIPFFSDNESVNFDGFNGSRFVYNRINGYVDVRLHGHHHGSSFTAPSHYHGTKADHKEDLDHTKRYHDVFVAHNKITSPGPWALRYYDQAHSVNDRTNASEQNEELNKEHVHFTKVHLNNNHLIGSGLMVDIFNAKDEKHLGTRMGHVEIAGNLIELVQEGDNEPFNYDEPSGISLWDVRDAHVMVQNNTVTNKVEDELVSDPFGEEQVAGVRLYEVDKGQVHISGLSVSNTYYGIWAARMTKTTDWWIHGLAVKGVPEPIYYDSTVANHPRGNGP